ncbi:SpaA isopeptide-forming pilin-related protein [Anaerococcus degeneri]|uniref:Fibrinogen-binding adhesin SdrG C-terminal domain-containing protein n=1 Tax=Anaerococcus degeneri TaxID=361500 RepID=A0ABS7YWX0_9FIRM|nr:SpaA isopeptide-forming pilin-related protein [Anaerococcus degeneri]MBP2015576.1 putative surface anchored protein [Anaerococcus degeneri]MCA2095930.1 fibrinogen-binding adhesin SdrG C-terminal domain-containing protein [Anaerococcus degeneri]
MKGKMSLLTRKIFASIVAISMSIPPTAFANAPAPVVYDANSSIMGLAPKKEDQTKVENTDQTKIEKDLGDYSLEITSAIDESLTKIDYTIKAKRKKQARNENQNQVSDENLSLTIAKTPTSNINKIKLVSKNTDTETNDPDFKEDFESIVIKSKASDEIIYKLRADVNKAKDQRSYDLIIGLKEADKEAGVFTYNLKAQTGATVVDNQTVELIQLVNKEEKSTKVKGDYKKEGILGGLFASHDTITWTDYIVNEEDGKETTYDFDIDKNQEIGNAQIGLDYYELTENGFEIKKEFSQKIDFSKKVKFEIPKGFIAKLSLQTKVSKKNTHIKSYSLNKSVLKNPIYIEGNEEEKSSDEEDPLPEEKTPTEKPVEKPAEDKKQSTEIKVDDKKSEENKTSESKKEEKTSDTQITVTDANGNEIPVEEKEKPQKETISAIILNKDSLIARLKAEGKLTNGIETAIESLAQNLDSYNQGKITDQDLKDFTKALAANNKIEKSDLRFYLESILSGLNKQKNKAANLNYDEIITYAYPEKKESQIKVDDKKTEKKPQDKKENQNKDKSSVEKSESKPAVEKKSEKPSENKEEKESAIKVFDANLDKLKEEAKKEDKKEAGLVEGLKSLLGQTDLQKADKELKKALADKSKGLEEIQNLLDSFETKYKLSKADQAKLMDDNGDAIRALVEKDRNNNFRPHIFADTGENAGLNLDGKKFNILTRFDTSNRVGPIKKNQFFNIILDKKLMVNDQSSLEPIRHNGRVIAKPSYDSKNKIITYTITEDINENIQVPLNIPVDYDKTNITLDSDGTFTVTNKVSGLGVQSQKDLLPQRIDKNGNPAGSIIEPDRDDVIKIIDDKNVQNYQVPIDVYADPEIIDGKLTGINWTVRVHSDTDLQALGYHLNLTTVKGSGLGEVQNIKINGETADQSKGLTDNPIKGQLGIVDSKHHTLNESTQDLQYNFYTKVDNVQGNYLIDITIYLKAKDKAGAVRYNFEKGFTQEAINKATPTRVGINNRTTIQGKFLPNDKAQWTITDAISSGDEENNGMPLADRTPGGAQTITSANSAVYGLDTDKNSPTYGKMVVKKEKHTTNNSLPSKGSDPAGTQPVGNIAVYEYDTNLTQTEDKKPLTLSGVEISKYRDLYIDQHWNLPQGYETMPEQDISVVDKSGKNNLGSVHVGERKNSKQRFITVSNVKYWDINEKGEASPIDYKIKQTFPAKNVRIGTKEYKYNENTSYYNGNDKNHFILNSLMEVDNKKPATFKIVKVDSKTGDKLQGASFHLLGTGISVVTDANGEATFTNIPPGIYQFTETKAPKGYKLDGENKTITISDNGEVSVSGKNADFSQPAGKTEVVEHNNQPNWPDYMNAMHYAKVGENGEVEFYLYLKPIAPRQGGETDRNTRLNISIPGVNITDVTAYDVSPGYRPYVKSAMEGQTANNLQLGNNVINANHKNKITGDPDTKDAYTGRTGYQIYFPKERFAKDWGFLVKVKANIGQNNSASLYYDWLTNEDTANQTNLQKVVSLSKNTSGADDKPTITIKNTPFEKKPIEVFKFANTSTDGKRDRLSGAEFVLKDSEGNVIANKITDENGKASFGKYPEGKYTIEEVKAPDGYEKNGVYFEVEVNESKEVRYTTRFENSSATPVPGQDYFIEKGDEIGKTSKEIVTSVNQWLDYNEGQAYGRGERPKVWEAYRYESLKYHADITLSQSNKGDRFEIQFDPNLDFTQYFAGFPKIRKGGKDIADPYFDYNTNLLTYVFNENTDGGNTTATIDLIGMIPSKYYAKNTGTYPFTITVQPKQTGISGQKLNKDINAFFDAHDSGNDQPVQNYYFREIYEENGEYYVDVISYYNVIGDRWPYKRVNPKTLNYNWITTNFQGGNIADWVGEGTKPRQVLDRVKIYRTEANVRVIHDGPLTTLVNDYMPQSMGFRAEQEPNIYRPVFNASVDPNKNATISQNGITLVYNKDKINPSGKLIDNNNQPLKISMPSINNGEGYVIEQRFKIPDIDAFNKKWRAYVMNNGNLKSAFASGANKSFAKGDQTGGETPKYYKEDVGVINKKYTPGQFKIIKSNQSDNSKLAGATFELTDAKNNSIYRTSDGKGELSFKNLAPGSYTLKETRAPDNFVKSEKKWSVTVYSDGSVRIIQIGLVGSDESYFGNNENIIIMPVSNKPTGTDFRVYKKDTDGKALQGAEFTITKPNDSSFQAIKKSTNPNGFVEFEKLTQGTYIIEESKAPTGYKELKKKWVLVIDDKGNKKVYNYRENSGTTSSLNSILEKPNVNWVDVKGRSLEGWTDFDNRRTGWTGNNVNPFKMGTRIVGINRKDKYVIQRYVLNPEEANIGATTATIHREKPEYPNMDWYSGALNSGEEFQVFKLNKPVTGVISDIRLAEYGAKEITGDVTKEVDDSRFGEPHRLKLNLPETDEPLVIDVKIPYKEEYGGVGTGMDWTENGITYWKSDYYESASVIKEASPVLSNDGNIIGSYVGEGSLDVTNELKTFDFKLKKVKENDNKEEIVGAKFRLTGPGEGGEEREITTGKDGLISFDKLRPGIYKLEEIEPAPGYEKSNVDWTVRITSDGSKYIKVNKKEGLTANTNLVNPNANGINNNTPVRTLAYRSLLENNSHMLANKNLGESPSLKSMDEFNTRERLALAENTLEFSEESIPTPLRSANDWQKVDPNASIGRRDRIQDKDLGSTKITEINKVDKKFRQVFLLKDYYSSNSKREVQFHREPEKYGINLSDGNTTYKIYTVDPISTLDNPIKIKDITEACTQSDPTPSGKQQRIMSEIPATIRGPLYVEIETYYNPNFGIGLGVDYVYSKGASTLWIADSYDAEDSINKNLVSSYKLKITNGANGSVTAEKTTDLKKNEKVTLTISPSEGYELEKLTVAGVDVTNDVADGKYSFKMPASNVAVSATFREKQKQYDVQIATLYNGKITQNKRKAKAGEIITLKIEPADGYELTTLKYTDEDDGEEHNIDMQAKSFLMPATSVYVEATFTKKAEPKTKHKIHTKHTGNGKIDVDKTEAAEGEQVTFNPIPDVGNTITRFPVVKSDSGKKVNMVEWNSFIMPNEDVTIEVGFKPISQNVYPITVEPSKNGKVSVNAIATSGEEVTVSVTPNEYYELDTLTVTDINGNPVKVNGLRFTMPESGVNISATFKVKEITGPQDGEIVIPSDGELIKITNKQTGLDLKIFKRDSNSRPLEGGKFTLKKTDKNYTTEDTTFEKKEGFSRKDGKLVFTDNDGKIQPLALEPGYYLLEETESPSGYKKAQAPWKIRVYEDTTTNQLKAEYRGPDETPNSFVSSDKALDSFGNTTGIKTTENGIKYAARMTHINTEGKTYIQRIYIDTRAYNGPVNVQIKPVVKREEFDVPGQPPKIGYEGNYGVKTAYRSTYEIKGLAENPTDAKLNDIFRNYTIANDDVSVVNTARWRPFDWGFDEDQLNLDPGVYYIDVEGFYDDNITKADIGKIEMNVDFKTPRYFWQADGLNQNRTQHYKLGGSYQAGAETFGSVYQKDTYVNGELKKKGTPTPWGAQKPDRQKYANWLSKKFTDSYGNPRNAGIVAVPYNGIDKTIDSVTTSINIRPLYTSNKKTQVGPEGMDIVNEEETYNITFSKHGRDDKDETVDGEAVTKRRLEGAVFKLQEYVINGYKDVEGSTIASAFNGYFGFRGLKPGRYQLIEVKAPEGYKPINGPLLRFTVETIKTNSGKIVDPESGEVVDIKSIKVKFSENDEKAYNLSDLNMVNPDNKNEIIKVSSVDSKKISIKDSKIVHPTTNDIVNLNDLIIATADNHEYPIKQIKIVDGSSGYISLEYDKANGVYQYVPEKSTSEKDGKLVDFVTSATAKNMGKIINEKPGKGKITVKKVDQKGDPINATEQLPGAKFKLTNISTGAKEEGTVGADGTLEFTRLQIGNYRLEEVKSPDGYINNKQVWNFTVGGEGLDPYAKDAPQRRKDVSSSITLSESKLSVLNPESKKDGLLSGKQDEMHPHFGEVFEFNNKYTIDSNLKINPGDYFVLKLSDNIDLHGIMETHIDNLDIIADGVGTIAKADYNRTDGTITYTFTNYADTYNLVEFSNKLKAYINLNKVPKAGDQKISRGVVVNDQIKDNKEDTIKVVYDSMTAKEKYQTTDGNWHEMTENHLNLGSKIIKYNPDTGEFVHYYYVNRDRSTTPRSKFYYYSNQDIENLNIDYYSLDGSKVNVNDLLPLSFGVNEDDKKLPAPVQIRSRSYLAAGQEESITFTGGLNSNSTYLLKVTGKVSGKDKSSYVGHGKLQMIDNPDRYVTRWDKQYFFRNEATAKANLVIQAVNPENKIKFKKVDQDGKALKGATFQLKYKVGENWNVDTSRDKTTGDDGVFEYTKLKPGSYRVIEITAPTGYKKAKDPVAEFDVDENGRIIRKDNANNPVGGTAEDGIKPIEIVNKKEQKISFVKVDAGDKKPLEGAEFEVWYKAKKEDTEYTKLKLYEKTVDGKTERLAVKEGEDIPTGFTPVKEDKFITGDDGKIEFTFYENGYYALKEEKAPKGYIRPRDYVKEFVYKEGKLYELVQANLSMSLNRSTTINSTTDYPEHNDEYTLIINPDNKMVNYLKSEGGNPKATITLSGFNSGGTVKVYLKAKGQEVQKTGYVPTFNFTNNQDLVIDLNKAIASIKAGSDTTGTTDIKSDDSIVLEIKEETSWNTEVNRNIKLDIKDKNANQLISENKDITVEASFASGGDNVYSGTKKFDSLPEIKSTDPIKIENKKGEYPFTGGPGTWIGFTIGGLAVMIGGAYIYHKRRESIEANS